MFPKLTQLQKIIIFVIFLLLFGTIGFSYGEKLNFSESFYQTTLIILSHFDHYGFRNPFSRWIVVSLISASLIIIAYLLKYLAEYMIGLGDGLKRRQMKRKAAKLKDHYIICGLGRVGSQVAKELEEEEVDFVGVDRDDSKVKNLVEHGGIGFVGDSTKEEVLITAGVKRAKGLIASLGEDSNNLFVTLTSRQLNQGLFIVSRANREENKDRLLRAGADRVALPYQIGGYHMATMMIRPNVVDFLDVLSTNDNSLLQIEELIVSKDSNLAGEPVSWLDKHQTGAIVLAINSNDGSSKVNPTGSERIYTGDRLILMGTRTQLDAISSVA
ncbi:MAG: NAD-binding protein [bacterium]|nr:NAD-binding protein [bacterium]